MRLDNPGAYYIGPKFANGENKLFSWRSSENQFVRIMTVSADAPSKPRGTRLPLPEIPNLSLVPNSSGLESGHSMLSSASTLQRATLAIPNLSLSGLASNPEIAGTNVGSSLGWRMQFSKCLSTSTPIICTTSLKPWDTSRSSPNTHQTAVSSAVPSMTVLLDPPRCLKHGPIYYLPNTLHVLRLLFRDIKALTVFSTCTTTPFSATVDSANFITFYAPNKLRLPSLRSSRSCQA